MLYLKPNWPAPTQIKAFTTTRSGWSRNVHEPHNQVNQSLEKLLDLPSSPLWLKQEHTAIALEAIPQHVEKIGDASFTKQHNHVCIVETADCLPILICNKQASMVAAIHAGWRGLSNHIIETTLDAIQQSPNDLLVWLGPAIGPQHFEVGEDVYDAFTSSHPHSSIAFTPHHPGKWLANLYLLARMRLQARGVNQIYGGEYCTHTQADLFFSYRRDKGITGRMASVIWIA